MMKELKKTDARQGETRHMLRYVLAFGLVLAVLAMGTSWALFS